MSNAAEILAVASELSRYKSEAYWRSAVSRAYYASFHALRAWHARLPMPGSVGAARSAHEQLIQQLCHPAKECSVEQRKRSLWFSGQLDSLRALRVIADYELDEPVSHANALHACAMAGKILEETERP